MGAMTKPRKPVTRKTPDRLQDNEELLQRGLRRIGMSQPEIDSALRKKKRRKVIEFNTLKASHQITPDQVPQIPKRNKTVAAEPAHTRITAELCTVNAAAKQLKLHPKTLLRYIREGKLPATRVGKSYRIRNADLESFAGLPEQALPAAAMAPTVTTIMDIPGIDAEMAKKLALGITSNLNGNPAQTGHRRAETIYTPANSHMKVVLVGAPDDVIDMLSLVRFSLKRLQGLH
jgi:excisionase family DNA binding protein